MNLTEDFWRFIEDNKMADPKSLLLSVKSKYPDIDIQFALIQIEARRKYLRKLPSFCVGSRNLFPTSVSAEQATMEVIAEFHASLIPNNSTVLDMTGGLCIDSFFFSQKASRVDVCDLNPMIVECAVHNVKENSIDNINVNCVDCVEYIKNTAQIYDVVYIDPARRNSRSERVYDFSDCSPDIISVLQYIFAKTNRLIIKASPMLDISRTLKQLKYVSELYVNSYKGDCKEILCVLDKSAQALEFNALDFDDNGICSRFSYCPNENIPMSVKFVSVEDVSSYRYLLLPMASLMKFNAWNHLSVRFPEIKKIHPNSHIFVSDSIPSDFPGKIFLIKGIHKLRSPEIKALRGKKINVFTRNFPMSADDLRKKIKVYDGGDFFLCATTLYDDSHRLFVLNKITEEI